MSEMFLTGEASEFVLGVSQTSNEVSNHVIIQKLLHHTNHVCLQPQAAFLIGCLILVRKQRPVKGQAFL